MVFHLVLCQLKPGLSAEVIESMMRETRTRLLKVPEVKTIRCGQRIDGVHDRGFFVAIELESMEKCALFHANPVSKRHYEEIIAPHTAWHEEIDYELEPGKDVTFS